MSLSPNAPPSQDIRGPHNRSRFGEQVGGGNPNASFRRRWQPLWSCPPSRGKEATQLILRWFHIIAGITWVGLLYFFNLINVPFMKQVDAACQTEDFSVPDPARPELVPLERAGHGLRRHVVLGTVSGRTRRATPGRRRRAARSAFFLLVWIGVWAILFLIIKKVTPSGYVLGAITAILVYAAGWIFVNYTPVGGDDNHVLSIGVGGGMGSRDAVQRVGHHLAQQQEDHPRNAGWHASGQRGHHWHARPSWRRGQTSSCRCRCCSTWPQVRTSRAR